MEATQRTLIFTREERVQLIEAADFGCPRPTNQKLRSLLYHLEHVSGSKGCFPSRRLLALRMACDERTVTRTLRQAERLGLITTTPRHLPRIGKRENEYQVHWDALRRFCLPSELTAIAKNLSPRPPKLSPRQKKCQDAWGHGVRTRPDTVSGALSNPELNLKKPPPEVAPEICHDAQSAREAAWQQAEEEVYALGVDLAETAVAQAISRGCRPEEILAVARFARQQRQSLGPGAIYCKLQRMRPGDPPERGWPKSALGEVDVIATQRVEQRKSRERDEAYATQLIKAGRRDGLNDEQIQERLQAAGLQWC